MPPLIATATAHRAAVATNSVLPVSGNLLTGHAARPACQAPRTGAGDRTAPALSGAAAMVGSRAQTRGPQVGAWGGSRRAFGWQPPAGRLPQAACRRLAGYWRDR
jgi:hypothetical protein